MKMYKKFTKRLKGLVNLSCVDRLNIVSLRLYH